MLWERKACLKAALVVILLFSLFGVSAMAMPIGTPFISLTNGSDGSGYTIREPGDSPTDGNWIILHGGSEIDIPATTFHYSGNAFDHSIGTGLSGLPFFDQLGIGTEYDMAHVSLQDVTVPYTTYPVYTDVADKNNVTATFYGDQDLNKTELHVLLLDLTQVSDKIDFTSASTITNSMKLLTLQDIRDSKIADVPLMTDDNGDITAIESSVHELSGMTQGYYMLLVVDENTPNIPCIVAEAPIIVTEGDMSTTLWDPTPKPGRFINIHRRLTSNFRR